MDSDNRYKNLKFSFEFFPPRNEVLEQQFWSDIDIFKSLNPDYVSVTYGAGGTTKDKTYSIVKRLKEEKGLITSPHLTCVDSSKQEVNDVAKSYLALGINKIVALRGDPKNMEGKYQAHPEGYAYSAEMVKGLKEIGDFDIAVACFPEVHPEAESAYSDIKYLKLKFDSGANRAISQYCFDTDVIINFIEQIREFGITGKIVPGIITINNFKQIESFSKKCGANVPSFIERAFSNVADDKNASHEIAADIAFEQISKLAEYGINEFHIYTLNNPEITAKIYQKMGLI